MNRITVSVIVPVYNSERFLNDCIASVEMQSLENMEVIFINDGSTDKSLEILENYKASSTKNITVITKENGGQASARNLGISMARGEYIGFLDSDDIVEGQMFLEMYSEAREKDLDYVECNYKYIQVIDGQEKVLKTYGDICRHTDNKELYHNPLVSPWNKIYRASILKENRIIFPEGVIYEDTSFYAKAIPFLKKIGFVDKAFIHHFLWGTSTMNAKNDERIGNIFPVMKDIISFYKEKKLFEKYHDELELFCVRILLLSSLGRIANVQNRKLYREYISQTWNLIESEFPNYKKNSLIPAANKGKYLKMVTRRNTSFFCMIFRLKRL